MIAIETKSTLSGYEAFHSKLKRFSFWFLKHVNYLIVFLWSSKYLYFFLSFEFLLWFLKYGIFSLFHQFTDYVNLLTFGVSRMIFGLSEFLYLSSVLWSLKYGNFLNFHLVIVEVCLIILLLFRLSGRDLFWIIDCDSTEYHSRRLNDSTYSLFSDFEFSIFSD